MRGGQARITVEARSRGSWLITIALILVMASPAAAQDDWGAPPPEPVHVSEGLVFAMGGALAWLPLMRRTTVHPGFTAEAGWRWRLTARTTVDARFQWRELSPFSHPQRQFVLYGQIAQELATVGEMLRLTGGASAGLGVWTTCLRGDFCGGLGPTVGVHVAVGTVGSTGGALELGVESQTGLVNGVVFAILPVVRVAVAF